MQTVETTTSSPYIANTALSTCVVSEIADKYEEQVRLEKLYQEEKNKRLKNLS